MRETCLAIATCLFVSGCGTAVPGGILIGRPTLEGRWIVAAEDGTRLCLTVQESRISILTAACGADGRGLSGRITSAPPAVVAGPTVTLTASFNPFLFDRTEWRMVFTGTLQPDGTYVGSLRMPGPENEETMLEQAAVLGRP